MGRITLTGALPKDHNNGLTDSSKLFVDEPRLGRLFVGIISSRRTVTNEETGEVYPVLRIQHWELIGDKPADQKAAAKLLATQFANRTGKVELPFPPGEVIPTADAEFPVTEEGFEEALNLEGIDGDGE